MLVGKHMSKDTNKNMTHFKNDVDDSDDGANCYDNIKWNVKLL